MRWEAWWPYSGLRSSPLVTIESSPAHSQHSVEGFDLDPEDIASSTHRSSASVQPDLKLENCSFDVAAVWKVSWHLPSTPSHRFRPVRRARMQAFRSDTLGGWESGSSKGSELILRSLQGPGCKAIWLYAAIAQSQVYQSGQAFDRLRRRGISFRTADQERRANVNAICAGQGFGSVRSCHWRGVLGFCPAIVPQHKFRNGTLRGCHRQSMRDCRSKHAVTVWSLCRAADIPTM